MAGPEATSRRTPCWGWPEGKENLFARSRGLLAGEVCLLLHHTTSALGVLAKHGPRAFGGGGTHMEFTISHVKFPELVPSLAIDGIELFVI